MLRPQQRYYWYLVLLLYNNTKVVKNRKHSEPADLPWGSYPAKFSKLPLSCSDKYSVKNFPDPEADTDRYQNQIIYC